MPALVTAGRPSPTAAEEATATSEPFLIESVLGDVRELLRRSRRLQDEITAEAACRSASAPVWSRVACEVAAVHERAVHGLWAGAARDGVALATDYPLAAPAGRSGASEEVLARCRRWARELEQLCTTAISHASTLGLDHLTAALRRWRRDLIGLERPLIAAHATAGTSQEGGRMRARCRS